MLAVWHLEAKESEVIHLLTGKRPEGGEVFETTKRAREPYVWDGRNLIVNFNDQEIAQAMKDISEKEDSPAALLPEAFACLWRGLETTGKSTAGLKDLSH